MAILSITGPRFQAVSGPGGRIVAQPVTPAQEITLSIPIDDATLAAYVGRLANEANYTLTIEDPNNPGQQIPNPVYISKPALQALLQRCYAVAQAEGDTLSNLTHADQLAATAALIAGQGVIGPVVQS